MKKEQKPIILSAAKFLEKLEVNGSRVFVNTPIVVKDDVIIEGLNPKIDQLSIENVTFRGEVRIVDIGIQLDIGSSRFKKILEFIRINAGYIHIYNTIATDILFDTCIAGNVALDNCRVSSLLGLGELQVNDFLRLFRLKCPDIRPVQNYDPYSMEMVKTPMVETDSPVIARQFELLGIPVVLPTATVRTMMAAPEKGKIKVAR